MGCGDDGLSCDFVSENSRQWTSKEECTQAIPDALLTVGVTSYPMLTASCDAKIEQAEVFVVLEQEAESGPATELGPIVLGDDPQNEKKPALYRLKDGYALVFDETANSIGKLGNRVLDTYSLLKDAVKLSFTEIAEATGRSVKKIEEVFGSPKN